MIQTVLFQFKKGDIMESSTNLPAKRVLLVSPAFPVGSGLWDVPEFLRERGIRVRMPALGLLTVASMIPSDIELQLLDCNNDPLTDELLAWADAIFVSAMITQDASLVEILKQCNAAGVVVVAGGPHPTTSFTTLTGIDHLIWGEAEPVMDRFWSDFQAGEAKRVYGRPSRLQHVEEIKAFYGEDSDVELLDNEWVDVSESPLPRFDLLDLKSYGAMAIQSSRGCPIGCEFCDIWRRFGLKTRYKAAEQINTELDYLYELGWRGRIYIVADNLIGHKRRAIDLLKTLKEWQHAHGDPFSFFSEATANLGDDEELMTLMWEAGFYSIFLGIETPVAEALKETNKRVNLNKPMEDRVEAIQRHGMGVMAGMIIGFDNDPDDIADKLIDHVEELAIPDAIVGTLQALPDTDLYERLEEEGRMKSTKTTQDFDINFESIRPMEVIQKDFVRVVSTLYGPDLKSYFKRCGKMRDRLSPPYLRQRLSAVMSFFFSSKVGVLVNILKHPCRVNAFRFLAKTLVSKWWYFPTAVRQCLAGVHYQSMANAVTRYIQVTYMHRQN